MLKPTNKPVAIETLIVKMLQLVQEGNSLFEAIDADYVMFLVEQEFIIMDPAIIHGMDGTILTSKGMQYLRNHKA